MYPKPSRFHLVEAFPRPKHDVIVIKKGLRKRVIRTWISRRISEYGYAKAMSPMAWNVSHVLLAGLGAGTPLMLPWNFPFSSMKKYALAGSHWVRF